MDGGNMPNLDRTGPNGEGPLTGSRRGRCKGSLNNIKPKEEPEEKIQTPEESNLPGRGRGFGSGRGLGKGRQGRGGGKRNRFRGSNE